MDRSDLFALLPFLVLSATTVAVMLAIAVKRNHRLTAVLTFTGLVTAFLSLPAIAPLLPRTVTTLLIMDRYSLFFLGLLTATSAAIVLLSWDYLKKRLMNHDEYYILLLLATLGAAVLVASRHFISFFLGLEILSVSLYTMISYLRTRETASEAGIKYLVLAAASSAFLLFGMALLYAKTGTMEFTQIAGRFAPENRNDIVLLAGQAMIVIGIGFKLALAPFHMWTPDVYEGAPAPVTAFIATSSKGAMFALLLRFFTNIDIHESGSLMVVFTVIAAASMFIGNYLALFQNNVKRILAYSSIAHLGYLLIAFLASGPMAVTAAAYYLSAYFVTSISAFGVVTVLSEEERDADSLEDYRGLAWRNPWIAGIFTAALLSLAGIPLTAGFIGKFYVAAAGVGSALWLLVLMLVINSAIGLYYYLRVIAVIYSAEKEARSGPLRPLSLTGSFVVALAGLLLIWLGVYPSPLIRLLENTVSFLK